MTDAKPVDHSVLAAYMLMTLIAMIVLYGAGLSYLLARLF